MKLSLLSLCAALLLTLPGRAANPPTVPAGDAGHRYLFLIDTSEAMGRFRESIAVIVPQLIRSGMNGQMQAGDEFAIWTYSDKVQTRGFMPEMWLPEIKTDLAESAAKFLQNQSYQRNAFLYQSLVEMFKVIRASRSVTIILINDGSELLQGTPFDQYANSIFQENALKLRQGNKPFLTGLLAIDKTIIACHVNAGEDTITIPPIPAELLHVARLTSKPAPVVVAVNPPPAPVKPAPVKKNLPPPTKSLPAPTPGPTVAAPKPAAPAPLPAPVTAPVKAPAVPVPAPVNTAPPSSPPTPPPAPATMEKPAPVAVLPTAAPAVPTVIVPPVTPPPAPTPPPAITPTPMPANVTPAPEPATPAVAAPTAAPAPAVVAVVATEPNFSRTRLLVIGLGLLLLAGVVCFLFIRSTRKPARPSLISQSMHDNS